jgi:hypothetical protein
MEPVKGFLGRYLRRKLMESEVKTGMRNNDLTKMTEWMPKVWQHLNKFLETHSSSDVTIGRFTGLLPLDLINRIRQKDINPLGASDVCVTSHF